VVATACGVTIETATGWCGKKGLTNTRRVKTALEERFVVDDLVVLKPSLRKSLIVGANNTSWRKRMVSLLPETCVVRLRQKGQSISHWIILWDGHTYDPDAGVDVSPVPGWYPSSYLKLSERPGWEIR
jgi:hypothetical protein